MRLTAQLAALVLLSACGQEVVQEAAAPVTEKPVATAAPTPNRQPAGKSASDPTPKVASSNGGHPVTALGPLDEAAVSALLERWLSAQNRRKFDDYAELYAPKFFGVKRSGPRVQRYDRAGWLADRRKMFRRSMKVRAEDVRIELGSHSASIEFDQRWASRSYADRGDKRLVVVNTPEGLRIASEIMLASELLRDFEGAALSAEHFMFAVHGDTATYLVLSADAPTTQAVGAARLVGEQTVVSVARDVASDAIAEPLSKLTGKAVQLYSGGGVACKGTLGKPQLMHRMVPHFGTRDHWSGAGAGAKPLPKAAIAEAAWALSGERGLLVAPLHEVRGSCGNALWGRLSEARAPAIFTGASVSPADGKRVTKEVQRLKAFKREQANFKHSDQYDGGPWVSFDGASPELRSWRNNKRMFHSYSARAGDGCGGYEGALWAFYEVMGNDLWRLSDRKRPGGLQPVAVFDADGDGLIEVLVAPELYAPPSDRQEAGGLLRQRPDKGFEFVQTIEASYFDCGC